MEELLKTQYEAVLRDIEGRVASTQKNVAELQKQLRDLNQTAENILKLIREDTGGQQILLLPDPASQRYAHMSVRWAILCLLTETNQALSVQDIADKLIQGGIETMATNFANNVSSVLSQMKARPNPEVEVVDGKWAISETGRSAWNHIRNKQLSKRPRYQRVSA